MVGRCTRTADTDVQDAMLHVLSGYFNPTACLAFPPALADLSQRVSRLCVSRSSYLMMGNSRMNDQREVSSDLLSVGSIPG